MIQNSGSPHVASTISSSGGNPVGIGGRYTNPQGGYPDYYSMSGSPVCPTNNSCTSTTTQTVWVAGYQVAQMSLEYGCYGVEISQP
jgi:hypothetical protein